MRGAGTASPAAGTSGGDSGLRFAVSGDALGSDRRGSAGAGRSVSARLPYPPRNAMTATRAYVRAWNTRRRRCRYRRRSRIRRWRRRSSTGLRAWSIAASHDAQERDHRVGAEVRRQSVEIQLSSRRARPGIRGPSDTAGHCGGEFDAFRDLIIVAYCMASSARNRTDRGIVRPRALAVLRLITSSNLEGCSTGRSPGLAPFKILSTKTAARRQMSLMSAP